MNVFDNCQVTKTFVFRYVSTNTDPWDLIVHDDVTGIEHTFHTPNGGPAAKWDNTTFQCN